MDFGTSAWDVSSEAHHLTQSLFGNNKQGSKKAKKRKLEDTAVKPDSSKKIKPDSEFKKHAIDSKSKITQDVISPKSGKKQKKKKKKNKHLSEKREMDHGVGSPDKPEVGHSISWKGAKGKAPNVKNTQPQLPAEPVNGKIPVQESRDVGKKKKRKSVKSKSAGDENKATDSKEVEKNTIKHSKPESSELQSGSTNTGQEVNQDSKASSKKQKRKRKCKKNKFKDYSKEDELKHDKKVESNDLNETSESVMSETTKKKRKKKHHKKADMSSTENAEETSGLHVPHEHTSGNKKATSKSNSVSKATQAAVHSSRSAYKSKHTFDPAKLGALLSESKQSVNGDRTDGVKEDKHKHKDKHINETVHSAKPMTLLEKSKERLKAARFRYINEQLYTTTGEEAFEMFQEDREAFQVYHEGFQSQVEKWPTNPIDLIIDYVKARPKHLLVADFGCGDAKLSRSVPNKVHSFDLIALNDRVTVCDMAKVPLKDSSVDVAVFCLSLMGTNLPGYLGEANRVLKQGAIMKIAEVTSRFDSLGSFILKVEKMGFKVTNQDSSNKMFVLMDFRKTSSLKGPPKLDIQLSPCIYKKR